MVDIGIVSLDTSHARSFADILAERSDVTVAAVWDGGQIRDDGYVRRFCDQYGTDHYEDPAAMVGEVDGVLILSVDWNSHRAQALPFLEAAVPTLIDKPLAGSLGDIDAIRSAIGETPFYGGSAVPHHPDIQALAEAPGDRTIHCVGYNHPFYYGAHLADTIRTLADGNWTAVQPSADPGPTVDVEFGDGTFGTLRLDDPEENKQFSVVATGTEPDVVRVTSEKQELRKLYDSYLDTFIETIAGNVDHAARVLDAASLLVAISAALEHDQRITPSSELLADHDVPSDQFVSEYPAKSYVSWEPQQS